MFLCTFKGIGCYCWDEDERAEVEREGAEREDPDHVREGAEREGERNEEQ